MNADQKQEALRQTQRMIEGIWNNDFRIYDEYADENLIGIGSYEAEFMKGRDEFKLELMKRVTGYPDIYLDGEKFQVISNDTSSCVTAGEYNLFSEGHLLKQQRITAVWQIRKRKLRLMHMQFTDVQKDLNGPQHEYTRALKRHKEEQTMIPVRDHEGKLYMLEPADIEWIESARNYVQIRRADGGENLKVRAVFTEFIKTLPSQFLTVSRGRTINMDYVDSFSRNSITLIDGTTFRVSRSCQEEVMGKIRKIHTIFGE